MLEILAVHATQLEKPGVCESLYRFAVLAQVKLDGTSLDSGYVKWYDCAIAATTSEVAVLSAYCTTKQRSVSSLKLSAEFSESCRVVG